MKTSFYNHYIPQGNLVLLYNALTSGYIVMKKEIFDIVFDGDSFNVNLLESNYLNTFKSLVDNGFLVSNSCDEKLIVENVHYNERFSTTVYELTINTTLSCNLNCWYCYETHTQKSKISEDMVSRVIKNIRQKYDAEPFKKLQLNFFGGEPLLYAKTVCEIVEKIEKIREEFDFKMDIHFTTNGTIIPKILLEKLNMYKVSFQITFDGNKEQHNSVRFGLSKNKKLGTYSKIIKNIKVISKYPNCQTTVRINFSENTFKGLRELISDLDFCDRKKLNISLHQVWQVNKESLNKEELFEFIRYANSRNFSVNYMDLGGGMGVGCYADRYNQAVINYDGSVYKCTARDFNKENREGFINKDGVILWDRGKLMRRMHLELNEKCRECKLLPACKGFCSQAKIENGDSLGCALDSNFSVSDYIIQNFNNQIVLSRISKL